MQDFLAGLAISFFALLYLALIAGIILVQVLFLLALYKAMNNVPKEKRYFPSWFVWMMLVPLVQLVFMWMMFPWGVGRTLKNGVAGNPEAEKRADNIFNLGLAHAITGSAAVIFAFNIVTFVFFSLPLLVAYFVLWIIYWVRVSRFNRDYLKPQIVTSTQSM